MSIGSLSLEACDDDDISRIQKRMDLLGSDVFYFGLGMDAVGEDSGLGAGEGNGRDAESVNSDGRESNGGLFARGQKHVHFPLAGQRHDFLGEFD